MRDFKKFQRDADEIRELYNKYKETVTQKFVPKDQDLYDIKKWGFIDSFKNAVESGKEEAMRKILQELHENIYAFDMLTPEFCDRLVAEMDYFEEWCRQHGLRMQRPNTMNNYGAILDDFGFESTLNRLMKEYLAPFFEMLYPHVGPASTYDEHHGFVVEYALGKDVKLDFHVDSSDATLNVCLGKEFEGGELYFGGIRCGAHQEQGAMSHEHFVLAHHKGNAIFHLGKHRHLARVITRGRRVNLILWCRSSEFMKKTAETTHLCPSWCGVNKCLTLPKQWKCNECCYINPLSSPECEMCSSKRT